MNNKSSAAMEFVDQLAEAQRKLERSLIVDELERRDRANGITCKEPAHCDECFEGCSKCQPRNGYHPDRRTETILQ